MTYNIRVNIVPVSVVELPTFSRTVGKVWSEQELAEFTDFIALNPLAGALVPGTGGVRKMRWAAKGKGKRGGARVIYFFFTEEHPVFLVSIYAKSDRENITETERTQYFTMSQAIKRQLRS